MNLHLLIGVSLGFPSKGVGFPHILQGFPSELIAEKRGCRPSMPKTKRQGLLCVAVLTNYFPSKFRQDFLKHMYAKQQAGSCLTSLDDKVLKVAILDSKNRFMTRACHRSKRDHSHSPFAKVRVGKTRCLGWGCKNLHFKVS